MAARISPITSPLSAAGRWLEVVSHTDPKYGGLSAAVPTLGEHIARSGAFEISLAAFASPQEQFEPFGYSEEHMSFWPVDRKAWLHNPTLRQSFRDQSRQSDGIHIHGLWEQSTAIAAQTARTLDIPYILSAHGMLEPWALATKRVKKFFYGHLVERQNVAGAACLHALTRAEATHFTRFGARSPIAIIPNGVTIPRLRNANIFLDRFPSVEGKRIILFMARLHPKKGLNLLLQAWIEVSRRFPDAHLVLAGPGSEETESKLHRFIAQNGIGSSVLITGMLRDTLKWSALSAAECFVLPSYSEGLSISVLEAMGMGLPVLITEPCNMPEVEHYEAGWQIQPEPLALTSALTNILCQSRDTNRETGRRGAALIEKRYTWPTIANQMTEVYRWVQGGSKPKNVDVVYP